MTITIGLLLTNKKYRRLQEVGVFVDFPSYGIETYRIDVTKPLSEQPPCHAILHKYIDNMSGLSDEDCQIIRWLNETLQEFPTLLLVENIDDLDRFIQRSFTYEVIERAAKESGIPLIVPQYFVLPANTCLASTLQTHQLSTPLLAKPELTTGDAASHKVDVLLHPSSLPASYPIDMLIQQYHNHNGVIYKLYAVGNVISVKMRYSLPNVEKNEDGMVNKYTIDGKKSCPRSFSVTDTTNSSELKSNQPIEEKVCTIGTHSMDKIKRFVLTLERQIGKGMLGLDFIVDSENPSLVYCIDLNLFPSFTRFPDISKVMANYILQLVSKRE